MNGSVLVWFRQDLRAEDNAALHAVLSQGKIPIPLYIYDEQRGGDWKMGGASKWWLHHSLQALSKELKRRGSDLLLRRGDALSVLLELAKETKTTEVVWNRCYEASSMAQDAIIKKTLLQQGFVVSSYNASLLFEPWKIATKSGTPYQVFSKFWKTCLTQGITAFPQTKTPASFPKASLVGKSEPLDSWDLVPTKPDWAQGLRLAWTPGEQGARVRLKQFLQEGLSGYGNLRDRADLVGTSSLSPHLHFGEISPWTVWQAVQTSEAPEKDKERFLTELGWREFQYHLLFHHPTLPQQNLRKDFDHFPWETNDVALKAWQQGNTGFPIVDAGMRQLWETGWMHNRVRMVVASFLIKDLRLDWRLGETWFWDTLVDADLANNAGNWQWVAGSGADAAPYFRIFHPVRQGEMCDPEGEYVKRYVPELKELPATWIHEPHMAPSHVLEKAGISLGNTYPWPIVDHKEARIAALHAFAEMRAKKQQF